MPVPAGTFSVGRSVGNREDLHEKIFNIDPYETPFVQLCGEAQADAVLHEWQTDSLAAVDPNNAALEGDEPDVALAAPTARVQNNCQIMTKTAGVSGTQQAIKKAGRDNEMSYQIAKRGLELRRDMERIFSGESVRNPGAVDANGIQTTARRSRGFEHWVTTAVSYGATGANGANDTTALTDGTQRDFTEALLQGVLQTCATNGGKPTTALLGPLAKRQASLFTGRASARQAVGTDTVLASVSVFASDFGDIKLQLSLLTRARSCLLVDPRYVKIAYLRKTFKKVLPTRGDLEQQMLIAEATLQMGNQRAHAKVADLNV